MAWFDIFPNSTHAHGKLWRIPGNATVSLRRPDFSPSALNLVRPGQLSRIRPSRVGSDMDPDYPAAHPCATAFTHLARSDAVACRLIPLGRTRQAPLRNEKSSRSLPRRYDACPPGHFAAEAREACSVARQGTRNRNLCSAFPASPGVRLVRLTAMPLADLLPDASTLISCRHRLVAARAKARDTCRLAVD